MPLAYLFTDPDTSEDWAIWSWSHRDQHNLVRQAIQNDLGVNLTEYIIDPIVLDDFPTFLNANQRYHNDINGVLGTQGSDLSQLDPTDKNQVQAWIFLHDEEHRTWSNALGVS